MFGENHVSDVNQMLGELPPPPSVGEKKTKKKEIDTTARKNTNSTAIPFGMCAAHSKTGVRQFDVSEMNLSNAVKIVNSRFSEDVTLVPKSLQLLKAKDPECKYPNKHSTACYWCCHKFKSSPIGLPVKYIPNTNTFYLRGFFCCYGCALSYAFERETMRVRAHAASLLILLRKKIDGTACALPLHRAKHWSCLKLFGGPLTITQFRKQNKDTRTVVVPEDLHLIPFGFNVFKLPRMSAYKQDKQNMRKRAAAPASRKRTKKKQATRASEKSTRRLKILRYGSTFNIRSLKDVLKR